VRKGTHSNPAWLLDFLPGSALQWEATGTTMGTAGGATGSAPCCRR
jgi:hypothetical protein